MAVFGKRWSKAELSILDTSDDINELKKRLPERTLGAIRAKIAQLQTNPEPGAVSVPWTAEEIALFPKAQKVDKAMLTEVAEKLPLRDRNAIWKKLKSMGHIWIKTEIEEPTEDNPYPMHGKLWTDEELALFPTNRIVTKEIIDELAAKLPLRKPSSIWPKMKKEGYIWEQQEEVVAKAPVVNPLTSNEKYILSLAHELGFRAQTQRGVPSLDPQLNGVEDRREQIARNFNLDEDFTGGELYCAIGGRISPLPWEMANYPEVAQAHRKRDPESILAAAKVLHKALEAYING